MYPFLANELKKNHFAQLLILFFALLGAWWFLIYIRGLESGFENNAFTLIYPFLALCGGIAGLDSAKKWGGFKSHLGSAISFLSLGLFAQFFGQAMYAFDIYIRNIEVPYPSIGDVGYFGSIGFYIIGVSYLARVCGFKFSLRSIRNKIVSILLPILMLSASYLFFLQDYQFDWSRPLKVTLDFGYPMGQAVYVSIAILTLLVSRSFLGGIMKKPIVFIICALIFQYFSDFMFLYQANKGNWYVGGTNDFLYCASYFIMAIGLMSLRNAFDRISAN